MALIQQEPLSADKAIKELYRHVAELETLTMNDTVYSAMTKTQRDHIDRSRQHLRGTAKKLEEKLNKNAEKLIKELKALGLEFDESDRYPHDAIFELRERELGYDNCEHNWNSDAWDSWVDPILKRIKELKNLGVEFDYSVDAEYGSIEVTLDRELLPK